MLKEIDTRSNDGITVTFEVEFSPEPQYAVISVKSATEDFTLSEIPLSLAMDVYRHPYAYAARSLASGRLAS